MSMPVLSEGEDTCHSFLKEKEETVGPMIQTLSVYKGYVDLRATGMSGLFCVLVTLACRP